MPEVADPIRDAQWLDAVLVAVYLIASFAFGIFASRLLKSRHTDEEDYYLAGRKVPGWMNGTSTAVTYMNSDVAPAYCGMAVVVGLPIAWLYLSRFGFAFMIVAILFAARWRQLAIRTGPEFFSLRFGGRGGKFVRVYTSLFTVTIGMIPWIGAGLLGVHMIFGPVFDIEHKATTFAIILPVLLIYVWISGFAGVLVTDVLQSLIIILANILLLVLVMNRFGGPAGLSDALQAAHPEHFADIISPTPVPGHRVLSPLIIFAWLVVQTVGFGGNVGLEGQRYMSCKSPREAAKAAVWAEVGLFVMLLLLTLPVLGALVDFPELYHASPSDREKVYGLMLSKYLPTGLLGIALAALLASVMSTVDSHLNYGSQTLVNDVYREVVGEPSPRGAVWIGRVLMIVIMAAGIAVAYAADSLIGIAVVVVGMFGSTAAFAWAQWWWWRVNFWSWLSSAVGGPFFYFTLAWLLPKWSWWQAELLRDESTREGLAMLRAVLTILLTTTTWITVTLLTRPEGLDILKSFYRRARPMGLWGPIRRAVEAEDPASAALSPPPGGLLMGFLTAFIGFAWVALMIMAASQLAVARYPHALALAAASLLLAAIFRRAFRKHLAVMPTVEEQPNT